MSRVYGAQHDVESAVEMHLFGIAANNSGSSFLKEALATCRGTWNLVHEGQRMLGFAGPVNRGRVPLIWSAQPDWLARLTDMDAYDWPRTLKAWYFQAFARSPRASVFYTKAPPFLLYVDELVRHFRNARFLFMVRNPYAVCEGICRRLRGTHLGRRADLPTLAARHVANCLAYQRRNLERNGDRGTFFTYEAMCGEPESVQEKIRALAPQIDDLVLRQRLPVKEGSYNEMLTNMNGRQIARLDAAQIGTFNRVFRRHRDNFEYFGYEILTPGAQVQTLACGGGPRPCDGGR